MLDDHILFQDLTRCGISVSPIILLLYTKVMVVKACILTMCGIMHACTPNNITGYVTVYIVHVTCIVFLKIFLFLYIFM